MTGEPERTLLLLHHKNERGSGDSRLLGGLSLPHQPLNRQYKQTHRQTATDGLDSVREKKNKRQRRRWLCVCEFTRQSMARLMPCACFYSQENLLLSHPFIFAFYSPAAALFASLLLYKTLISCSCLTSHPLVNDGPYVAGYFHNASVIPVCCFL